jgi:hypothetical protein
MMYQTKTKNQEYLPSKIQSVVLDDIGIPIFFKIYLYRFGNQSNSISIIPGFYLWIPYQALNAENFKIYGGQGYEARSISYALCEKYYSFHLGMSFSEHLTEELNINIEPFINYQFNHKLIVDLDEELWYGLKVCINYSFKK